MAAAVALEADTRSLGHTPPQDLSAEQCVLGAMLLSKDAVAEVVETLRGADFYPPVHETIFDAIVDLYGRGEPVDAVTVADHLTKRGRWQSWAADLTCTICYGRSRSQQTPASTHRSSAIRQSGAGWQMPARVSPSSRTRGRAKSTSWSTVPRPSCTRSLIVAPARTACRCPI